MEGIPLDPVKIQVLLSTYNGENYIEEQLQSLISQQDVHVQILARDDGSSDSTVHKLEAFKKLYPNQIEILKGKNQGVIRSFFELIEKSRPEISYYAFCDQDDVWKPDKLAKAIKRLQECKNDQPLMYSSTTQMVDEHLNPIKVWPEPPRKPLSVYNASIENVCVGCTVVVNKETLELVKRNMPRNINNVIMHDWWIYLCVSSFGEVVFDPEPSILYRQHQSNVLGGASDGWLSKWRKRLNRFVNGNNHFILSKQAHEFLSTFGKKLDPAYYKDLSEFLNKHNGGALRRVRYVINTPFYRQSFLDDLIYRIVFIAGKL
ncbi:glycosyltransferase family 2 protein [Paenibacillus medicaginis]|uniref:Glycosyltransferase family 2 protein n=1 Tax=Paenibacillus medicaginis TaxID=1470560 RepID=A0ABV5C8N1_9BACL